MSPEKLKLLQDLAKLGDVLYLTKPKKDLIIEAIAKMNIPILNLLLDDVTTYADTTKEIFINKLENIFEDFKRSGDTELLVENGSCGSKQCSNCGAKGYRFVGNHSRDYFDFIFEMDGDFLKEISYCFLFETDKSSTDFAEPVYIEIKYDDRNDFNKTPKYWQLFNTAQIAYSEIITKPPLLLDIEGLDDLLEKYSNLYEQIIVDDEYNSMEMKWDIFLDSYNSLTNIKNYCSSNKIEILIANNLLEQISNENDLIDWVLKYEIEYFNIPDELLIMVEEEGTFYCCRIPETINFKGESFKIVYDFIASYDKHKNNLFEKYNTYTEEEFLEAYNSEQNNGVDLFSLQFHINKRKALEEIGIKLPYYLTKE